nr:MAG TPA: hypothetical protein [Caudoviricetes sp.]
MPANRYRSEISIIHLINSCIISKNERGISPITISLYLAGVVAQGVRFLLPAIVCQNTKNKK